MLLIGWKAIAVKCDMTPKQCKIAWKSEGLPVYLQRRGKALACTDDLIDRWLEAKRRAALRVKAQRAFRMPKPAKPARMLGVKPRKPAKRKPVQAVSRWHSRWFRETGERPNPVAAWDWADLSP